MDFWNADLRAQVQAVIRQVEGKSCVNIGEYDEGVYICRRISGLYTDEDCFNGQCEWVDPEEARPGELTDGMAIGYDCIHLGPVGGRTRTSAGTSCMTRSWWPDPSPAITSGCARSSTVAACRLFEMN